jgi:hypothetical protein
MGRTSTETKKDAARKALSAIGDNKATATASKTPEIVLTNQDALAQVKAVIDAKNAAKQAKSALDISQGAFRDTANEMFESRCREDGNVHTSVRFLGKHNGTPLRLTFTQPRSTTKMDEKEVDDDLHSIFQDDFDRFFEAKTTIEIDTDKLNHDQILKVVAALREVIDPEIFNSVVNAPGRIHAKDVFYTKRILDDRVRKLAHRAETDGCYAMKAASFTL